MKTREEIENKIKTLEAEQHQWIEDYVKNPVHKEHLDEAIEFNAIEIATLKWVLSE